MKELLILRHAKTDRIKNNQRDFDRNLTARGVRQCYDLRENLASSFSNVDSALVSSSKRTRMTFSFVEDMLPKIKTQYSDDLYLAAASQILILLESKAKDANSVLVVGHNDGLSELVSYVLDDFIHVPTSGFLHLKFHVDSWSHITKGSGILVSNFYSTAQ